MMVWAARADRDLKDLYLGCTGSRPPGVIEGTTEVKGVAATWFKCREGWAAPDSGHVLLQWSKSGVTYGVSFHGHNWFNHRLAMTMAHTLRIVRPPRSSG